METIRDNSVNFLAFVNSQDLYDIYRIHDDLKCEYEVNDGYVTAVLFVDEKGENNE